MYCRDRLFNKTSENIGTKLLKSHTLATENSTSQFEFIGYPIQTPCNSVVNFISLQVMKKLQENMQHVDRELRQQFENCIKHFEQLYDSFEIELAIQAWFRMEMRNGFEIDRILELDGVNPSVIKEIFDTNDVGSINVMITRFDKIVLEELISNKSAQDYFNDYNSPMEWKNLTDQWFGEVLWFLCGEDIIGL